jgi:hypothetical protein
MGHTTQGTHLARDGREAALTPDFAGSVHPTSSIRLMLSIFAWKIRSCAEKGTIMQAFTNLRVATKPLLLSSRLGYYDWTITYCCISPQLFSGRHAKATQPVIEHQLLFRELCIYTGRTSLQAMANRPTYTFSWQTS